MMRVGFPLKTRLGPPPPPAPFAQQVSEEALALHRKLGDRSGEARRRAMSWVSFFEATPFGAARETTRRTEIHFGTPRFRKKQRTHPSKDRASAFRSPNGSPDGRSAADLPCTPHWRGPQIFHGPFERVVFLVATCGALKGLLFLFGGSLEISSTPK